LVIHDNPPEQLYGDLLKTHSVVRFSGAPWFCGRIGWLKPSFWDEFVSGRRRKSFMKQRKA